MKEQPNYVELLITSGLFHCFQEGVWIADIDGRIVFANQSFARLLGLEMPERLHGRNWREFFPPAESAALTKSLLAIETVNRIHVTQRVRETKIITVDNQTVPVATTMLHKTDAGQEWFIGIVYPKSIAPTPPQITEGTAKHLIENTVDGICIIENGEIVYLNQRLEELTGYNAPQLLRMDLQQLLNPIDRKTITRILSEPSRILGRVREEVKILSRTGKEIECELRIVPLTVNGRTMLLCYLRDISALKQAERTHAEFIAMVSHDLRTPLAAIKEAISLLADTAAPRLEEKQRRYLTIAREELDRLNRMIDNLIEASRMEAGKVILNLEPLAIEELLNIALESLSLLITKKNLKIEKRLPAKIPPVLGDHDRLLRVLNNLLDNAIKYSPEGGTIRIDIEPVDPEVPILSGTGILANTRYVKVTITDQGPGIPAEFLDRIFGKFERVDPHGPGIGLGLAIVRSIVELHHGKVWARSVLGEGTRFSFILPTKEET